MPEAYDAFAPPGERGSAPAHPAGESPLHMASGVTFLISGGLISMWALWSVIGTCVGGVMGGVGLATLDEELAIGVFIFLIYGLWLVVCGIVGPLQLYTGVRMVSRAPISHRLRWAAAFGGLLATLTFYCALPGIVSFALGLAAVLQAQREEE